MRITQERLDSNIRVSKVELALSRAISAVIDETDSQLTEAEVTDALANLLSRRALRTRQSETKPYEGYEEENEDE